MRALIALLLSLWLVPAWAQVPMTGAGKGAPGYVCANTECTNWVGAVVGGGGTVSDTQKQRVDTLISCLKNAGGGNLWTKLDAYWLLASENVTQAKYEITGATGANLATTIVGSPTFTASQGYAAGVANTDYLTTTYVPSSSAVHLTQNSATIGSYVRTAQTARHSLYGGGDASNGLYGENYRNASPQVTADLNDSGGPINVSGYTVGAAGLHVFTRTGASATAFYYNGASRGTGSLASAGLPTKALYILTQNGNGTPVSGGTEQVAQFFIASGWNSTNASDFSTCSNDYMTSLGTNVY